MRLYVFKKYYIEMVYEPSSFYGNVLIYNQCSLIQ
jgi:hypothetical protein